MFSLSPPPPPYVDARLIFYFIFYLKTDQLCCRDTVSKLWGKREQGLQGEQIWQTGSVFYSGL